MAIPETFSELMTKRFMLSKPNDSHAGTMTWPANAEMPAPSGVRWHEGLRGVSKQAHARL
jgi:hypothetical protein